MPVDPSTRRALAREASLRRWAHEPNRTAATAAARRAAFERFEREVDPDFKLSPAERVRRAEALQRAHLSKASRAGVAARRRAAAARKAGTP